eukprot:7840459-Alexandrium_andersonii.AAC.1
MALGSHADELHSRRAVLLGARAGVPGLPPEAIGAIHLRGRPGEHWRARMPRGARRSGVQLTGSERGRRAGQHAGR